MFTASNPETEHTSDTTSEAIFGTSPTRARLIEFILRSPYADTLVLVLTTLLVGVGTGVVSVIFRRMIHWIEFLSFTWVPEHLPWLGRGYLVLVPAVGGLLVGPLIYFFAREAKGHGVPEVMEAVALRGGRIRPIVAVIKSIASAITIGTGGSVGSEGPIVQVGAALGSTLAQIMKMSTIQVRTLVACGAAAGIAAVFNAPIAGVMFSLEIILGEINALSFGMVVISAVSSAIIGRIAFGEMPAFIIPTYTIHSLWEFAFYALLGVLAGMVAVPYTQLIYKMEDIFDAIKAIPEWVKPAIGGALLGVLATAYSVVPALRFDHIPQVFGNGYGMIEMALAGTGLPHILLTLIFLKMIATALTLGSGASGGVFAPALFIGAMLGNAFGQIMAMLFPGIPAPAGAYALVGMAAVFAGSTSAPITAVLILFEMTGDYHIILPLMLSVVIATVIGRHLLKGESIYTIKLSRRGVRLSQGRDVDIMQGVLVSEAMTTNPDTVSTTMTLGELLDEFNRTKHHGFPVVDEEGNLYGIVTLQDVERALDKHLLLDTPVGQIATRETLVAYPDEPMAAALRRMTLRGVGRLPVVSREDPRKLVGIIRRADILRAYNLALTRRAELQHRAAQLSLRRLDGTEFIEITIPPDSGCVGRTIRELSQTLPADAVFVSIRRKDGQVVIPHGDTVIQAGDRITCFASSSAAQALQSCLIRGAASGGEQRDVPA